MTEPEIRFEPKAGDTYFEYERKDGTRFLSIISWDEWDLEQYGLEFICKVVWNGQGYRSGTLQFSFGGGNRRVHIRHTVCYTYNNAGQLQEIKC